MKNIRVRYIICGMVLTGGFGIWIGQRISSMTNFPIEVLSGFTLFLFGAAVICCPIPKLRWRLVFLVPIIIAALSIFMISMSIGVTFQNDCDTVVNISCIEIGSHQVRRLSLLPKQRNKLILCRGDSPVGFKDRVFLALATDKEGYIYYQGFIRIADIEKRDLIVLDKVGNK